MGLDSEDKGGSGGAGSEGLPGGGLIGIGGSIPGGEGSAFWSSGPPPVLRIRGFTVSPAKATEPAQFPVPGSSYSYVGKVPVPLVKPPEKCLPNCATEPAHFPFEGKAFSQCGRIPVAILPSVAAYMPYKALRETVPIPFPPAGWTFSHVGKTPALVIPPLGSCVVDELGACQVFATNTVQIAEVGACAFYINCVGSEFGQSRVQNLALVGYTVYVGNGSLPNLSLPPTAFSATLPINIPTAPPGVGTATYYVIVRKRDAYGLESQNQQALTITIDSSGNTIYPPIAIPQGVGASVFVDSYIGVRGIYPNVNVDQHPADVWRIWINTVPINPAVDTPTGTVSVGSEGLLFKSASPYAPGTYNIAVALYRTSDGAQSPAVFMTLVVPVNPLQPNPVLSGYELPGPDR